MGSFAVSLKSASTAAASIVVGAGEHRGFIKNFGGNRLEVLGLRFGTTGWLPQMLCSNAQYP